jgi:MFS family permease
MHWKEHLSKPGTWKAFFPAFILLSTTLVWNVFLLELFDGMIYAQYTSLSDTLILLGIAYSSIGVSALLGSVFFRRSMRSMLFAWSVTGALSSITLLTIANNNFASNAVVSLLFGISVGTGLPSTLAYFADHTDIENRGSLGGVTFFSASVFALLFVIISLYLTSAAIISAMVLWRIAGAALFFFSSRNPGEHAQLVPSFKRILSRKDLMLYLAPWLMFCIINRIEAPLLQNLFGDSYSLIGFIEFIVIGVFALIGGIAADIVGRKRVTIIGFIIVGFNYGMLSLLSGVTLSWYVYTALDSIAWGMFVTVFFMSLWGDLAQNHQKDKYYVIGGLPYLLTIFLRDLATPFMINMSLTTAFSLASFFLFLAVFPLTYAPETLPEKSIRERELKIYVEKAKETAEKYA